MKFNPETGTDIGWDVRCLLRHFRSR